MQANVPVEADAVLDQTNAETTISVRDAASLMMVVSGTVSATAGAWAQWGWGAGVLVLGTVFVIAGLIVGISE